MAVHKAKKNVIRRALNEAETLDFEAVGYNEKQIEKFEELLKLDRWLFWSKPTDLYITLKGVSALVLTASGQPQMRDESLGMKFDANYATTTDRETARLVFLSSAYRIGKIKLAADKIEDDKSAKVKALKMEVMRDKDLLERVKQELFA